MKSMDLLNSMDYIGEDLLAEAEQTVLVKTKRPWLKTAVAAVLVAAIGVGGWLFLNNIKMKPSVSATEPNTSTTDTRIVTTELSSLKVGVSWSFLPGRYHSLSQDVPSLYDASITQLPVYRDATSKAVYQNGSIPEDTFVLYSEEQMQTILREAAQRIGATVTGEVKYVREDGICFSLNAATDKGRLGVSADGLVELTSTNISGFAPAESGEDLVDNLDKVRADIAGTCELLNIPQSQVSFFVTYRDSFSFFLTMDDPRDQILARTFACVSVAPPVEGFSYTGISWYQRLGSTGWNDVDPYRWEFAGNYPLITLEEAKAQAAAGHFYSYSYTGSLKLEQLNDVELVYPDQGLNITMMPFYRFYLAEDQDLWVCVPAVRPEYLSDFPDGMSTDPNSEPDPSDETYNPIETEPVPTVDHLQLVQISEDQYEVQGPDGTEEALQYRGILDVTPLNGDVSGDGEDDLVYLFYGPTTDFDTIGIAIYGLKFGYPVLKGSEMFVLNDYTPSLEMYDGIIYFVLTPTASAPAGAERVQLKVYVEANGTIQLTGANFPENCQRDWLPEPTEEEITAKESNLPDGYYSKIKVNNLEFFSDGHTRIWKKNDDVLKKDLATGEVETLCTLEHNGDITTELVGVTKNRLYFGWNEAGNWWGVNVYSVDYHNENRIDWEDAQEVYFGGGWLQMESFRTDVRGFTLHVIDRNDQLVVNEDAEQSCWGGTVVDGSLYYVVNQYAKWLFNLSDAERDAVSDEERDEKSKHAQCDLLRLDPDGTVTTVGAVEGNGYYTEFWIDAERRELIYQGPLAGDDIPEEAYGWYLTTRYDLDTLAVKSKPWLFSELTMDQLDTGREVGVGINILKNDKESVIFYNYFGLFGFDGTTGAPLFYVDFDEVLDRQGFTQIQGSGGGTSCGFNHHDNAILVHFWDEERNYTQYLLVDLVKKVCYDPASPWSDGSDVDSSEYNTEPIMSQYGGETMAELWIEHNGEKWYPFQGK